MRVSVICTAKNAASTIESAVHSIVQQEFTDWELIVVDDGSIDNTVSVLSAFARNDPRVRIIVTKGVGRARALNIAIAAARAELIANLDADDESHSKRLVWTVAALERHPEFVTVCTGYIHFWNDAAPIWPELAEESIAEEQAVEDITQRLALANPVCHSSVLMRRMAVRAVGGYREDLKNNFDYDLWVRLAVAGLRIGRLRQPLAAKRIHAGQAFLHGPRLGYVATNISIQARALRVLGVAWWYWALVPLRFIWGLLPVAFRFGLRNYIGSRKF